MNDLDCLFCKVLLGVVTSGVVSAVMIRLASWYKYVGIFV